MAAWLIRCYCNEAGKDLFGKDYSAQDASVRAKFRAVLNGLMAQPSIEGWSRPNGFDRLSGKYRDLGKLRFKVQNVQHRPLGFFGPAEMTYTLLIWATERDSKYDPPDVRDTALKRMNSVLGEPETKSRACDFL